MPAPFAVAEPVWLNEPPAWSAEAGRLEVRTALGSDFWRLTHYGFVRHSGHLYGHAVTGDFDAAVRVDGAYAHQYDQAGLMVRASPDCWVKCGVEYVDGRTFVSAVVTRELSDWSVVERELPPGGIWIGVRRRGGAVDVRFGSDGPTELLRLGALTETPVVSVGPMAASPDGPGFVAAFDGWTLQPPDAALPFGA